MKVFFKNGHPTFDGFQVQLFEPHLMTHEELRAVREHLLTENCVECLEVWGQAFNLPCQITTPLENGPSTKRSGHILDTLLRDMSMRRKSQLVMTVMQMAEMLDHLKSCKSCQSDLRRQCDLVSQVNILENIPDFVNSGGVLLFNIDDLLDEIFSQEYQKEQVKPPTRKPNTRRGGRGRLN